nr:hypothetical protein [Tanacetum cinerariifolium]
DSPLLGVNTPRSDEDRLKLMELMVFVMKKDVCDEFEFNAARLSKFLLSGKWIELVDDQEKNAKIEGRQADKQAEIYNIDLDRSSKVLSMQEDDTEVQEAVEVVTTAKLITEVVTAAATQEHEEAYKNIDWNAAFDHVQSKETQSKENTKCVSAANEELTAAKHKLMLLI